jgi:hypothetical protein
LISVVDYYEEKIGSVKSAKEAMRRVAREVDKDGLFGIRDIPDVDGRLYVAASLPLQVCLISLIGRRRTML